MLKEPASGRDRIPSAYHTTKSQPKTDFNHQNPFPFSILGNQMSLSLLSDSMGDKNRHEETLKPGRINGQVAQCYKIYRNSTLLFLKCRERPKYNQSTELQQTYPTFEKYFNDLPKTQKDLIFDSKKRTIPELAQNYQEVIDIISFFKHLISKTTYEIEFEEGEPVIEPEAYVSYLSELVAVFNPKKLAAPISKSADAPPSALLKNKQTGTPNIMHTIYDDGTSDPDTKGPVSEFINLLEWEGEKDIDWAEDIFEFSPKTSGGSNSVITRPTLLTNKETAAGMAVDDWVLKDEEVIGSIKSQFRFSFGADKMLSKEEQDFFIAKGFSHQIRLSMIEGGNMLTGTDFALIGHDSLHATMADYRLSRENAIKLIASELMLPPPQVFFLKQLDYHIDTYLQLLSGRDILMTMPSKCPLILYNTAKQELTKMGFKVIETDIQGSVNGEFVIDKAGNLAYLANKVSINRISDFAKLMFSHVPGLKTIYITNKPLDHNGGIGCMFKGLPAPPETSSEMAEEPEYPSPEPSELPQQIDETAEEIHKEDV